MPNNNTSHISSGLQQIEDDTNGLPLPMGMAEEISNRVEPPKQVGKVEQLDDEDDLGPEPPASLLEASLNAADPDINNKISETISNNISSVNELNPPMPFDSATFETHDAIAKKKAKDEMNQKLPAVSSAPPSNRDSIYEPSREIIEGSEGISDNTNTGRGDTNRRGWEDIGSNDNARDIESQTRADNNDSADSVNNNSIDTEANVEVVPTSANQEAGGDAEIHIPEAFLVEDIEEEVYDATPVEPIIPWWKQRRAKIFFGVVAKIFFGVVIVLVGTLAIVLGIELSPKDDVVVNTVIMDITDAPTVSLAPSSSIAPSTSPPTITYECFNADDGGYEGVLYYAVRAYVDQDCANNTKCFIAQTYGWPMNSWCLGNVTDLSYLFEYMDTFNEDINGWNTSRVTNMIGMFYDASLFNGDLLWDTSSVTNMRSMFRDAKAFNKNVSNFDTSRVTNMEDMFFGSSSFNGNVSNFDTSSVTRMSYMFYGATSFNMDLCSWQDSFPYTDADDIFLDSNCTYQDAPNETQKGPFCASDCQ